MARLSSFTPQSFQEIPLGPGAVVANVDPITPQQVFDVVRGVNTTGGLKLGAMSAAPSFESESEIVDLMENIVGVSGAVKGSKQVESITASITITLSQLNPENLHLLHPGLDQTDWLDDAAAVIGQKFTPRGYFQDTDYTPNIVLAMPSTYRNVFSMIVVKNAINTESFSLELEDDGSVSGVEATLTAHAGEEDFNVSRGQFAPGYEFYIVDLETPDVSTEPAPTEPVA